jgi:hypothetical protein
MPEQPTSEIQDLFSMWNAALESGSADAVASLYADDAVLIPTTTQQIRVGRARIQEYFVKFIPDFRPRAWITESYPQHQHTIRWNSGLYSFEFRAGPGSPKMVRARFTFVYQLFVDRWLITQHHSSVIPAAAKEDATLLELEF